MACTDAQRVELNRLVRNQDGGGDAEDTAILTLKYGPYMNWGRWNHNSSRIDSLIMALVDAGFHVQLQHVEKETDFSDHGFVTLLTAAGDEIITVAMYQHNRNYRGRNPEKIVEACIEAVDRK